MADDRVWITSEFGRKGTHAVVRCNSCGWCVIFPQESVSRMFRGPFPLDMAQRKLRCRWCGKRDARLSARRLWRDYHG